LSLRTAHMCVRMIVHNCRTQDNTRQFSDNFRSNPPDSHHSSDDVYWRAVDNASWPVVCIVSCDY